MLTDASSYLDSNVKFINTRCSISLVDLDVRKPKSKEGFDFQSRYAFARAKMRRTTSAEPGTSENPELDIVYHSAFRAPHSAL